MNKQALLRLIAVLAVFAMFAAACGNDDSDEADDTGSGFFGAIGDDEDDGTPETTETTEAPDDDEPAPETTTTTSAPAGGDADPTDSDYLLVVGDLTIPEGEPGELSIVAMGPLNRGWVPVVVRNRTTETYYSVAVTGSAHDADGNEIGSGASALAAPTILGPGEWGIGQLSFGDTDLPDDSTVELSVSGNTSSEFHHTLDLVVIEADQTQGSTDTVDGTIENRNDVGASPPLLVTVVCFTSGGSLSSFHSSSAGNDQLAPGATATFSVALFEATECNPYVVAAGGFVR